MVPLAARQAPKSVPVSSWTPTFTQLCTRQSGAACPLTFSSPRHPVSCLCQPRLNATALLRCHGSNHLCLFQCVCVCCEFMKATSAHVGIQQGHPTPSGKTWPLQQSRHHLQTSHVFFWTRYAYTTIPIYPGQRCVRATGHKQWIIRQRDDVTYPYLVETYIYAHISMTDTDTHTHTYIYIYV